MLAGASRRGGTLVRFAGAVEGVRGEELALLTSKLSSTASKSVCRGLGLLELRSMKGDIGMGSEVSIAIAAGPSSGGTMVAVGGREGTPLSSEAM